MSVRTVALIALLPLACIVSPSTVYGQQPSEVWPVVNGATLDWWTEVSPNAGAPLDAQPPPAWPARVALDVIPSAGRQNPGEYTCVAWAAEAAEAVLARRTSIDAALVGSTYDTAAGRAITPRAEPIRVSDALQAIRERANSKVRTWSPLGRQGTTQGRLVREMASALRERQPVIIVMPVDATFSAQSSAGVYQGCQRTASELCRNYHAMLVVEVDAAQQQIRALNSYGTSWGENGIARIAFAALESTRLQAVAVLDDSHRHEEMLADLSCDSDGLPGDPHLVVGTPRWSVDNLPVVQGLGRLTVPFSFSGRRRWQVQVDLVEPSGAVLPVEPNVSCGTRTSDCQWTADVDFPVSSPTFVLRVTARPRVSRADTLTFSCPGSVPAVRATTP